MRSPDCTRVLPALVQSSDDFRRRLLGFLRQSACWQGSFLSQHYYSFALRREFSPYALPCFHLRTRPSSPTILQSRLMVASWPSSHSAPTEKQPCGSVPFRVPARNNSMARKELALHSGPPIAAKSDSLQTGG